MIQEQRTLHEMMQAYLDKVYASYSNEIRQTLHFRGNEIYGEILYYSAVKLINYLNLTDEDYFLDIGSGLGKLAFFVFLTSQAKSVTGIEINHERHVIAAKIKKSIQEQLPDLFCQRAFNLIEGDFLKSSFDEVTVVYICSTIFSYELLENIGKKLNEMKNLRKIASFRKLPYLSNFKLVKKLLVHCSWERVGCYVYERV